MTQPNPEANNGNEGGQNQPTNNVDLSKIDSVEKLPKWAQDELSRARNDAASYRNRLKDAKSEVEVEVREAVKQEIEALKSENDTLKGDLATSKLTEMRLDAALAVEVPGEQLKAFASRLQGSTAEEIEADAKAAAALFGIASNGNGNGRATDPTAGLGGNKNKQTPEGAFGDFVKGKLSR